MRKLIFIIIIFLYSCDCPKAPLIITKVEIYNYPQKIKYRIVVNNCENFHFHTNTIYKIGDTLK